MLAANVCAGDFMKRSRHPGLFRVHEGPTVDRLRLLREFLRSVGLSLGGGEEPSPRDYAELAAQVRGRPDAMLLQTMMLRSMQQAVYSPHNSGHFGLAYDVYTHFTSPIRRYPDLLTHRVIKALLRSERYLLEPVRVQDDADEALAAGETRARGRRGAKRQVTPAALQASIEAWEQFGVLCSANERRADEASRDVEAWLKCQYMRERVGEQFAGRVTGVAPFGVFVTLQDLYVDGLVHVSELGSEYFQYNEAAHELRGERTGRRFRLTDELHVQVSRVDLEARRIEFRPVQRMGYREVVTAGARPREAGAAVDAGPRRKAPPPMTEEARLASAARREARKKPAAPAEKKRGGSKRKRRRQG